MFDEVTDSERRELELQASLRMDLHNVSVHPVLASLGRCGMTHLATGRVCVREARHAGACDFRPRKEAWALFGLAGLVDTTGAAAVAA